MAKILLVEDDNNLREIYEARLQAEGYTIVSAHDGEEALVVAKAEKPDLIISDVMMPKISGFEMLDILRNTDSLKNVKVIMLTALGQSEDQQRATKLGTDRYLVKSQVTLEDIVNEANALLQTGSPPVDATMPKASKSLTSPPAPAAPAPVQMAVAPEPAATPSSQPARPAPTVTSVPPPPSSEPPATTSPPPVVGSVNIPPPPSSEPPAPAAPTTEDTSTPVASAPTVPAPAPTVTSVPPPPSSEPPVVEAPKNVTAETVTKSDAVTAEPEKEEESTVESQIESFAEGSSKPSSPSTDVPASPKPPSEKADEPTKEASEPFLTPDDKEDTQDIGYSPQPMGKKVIQPLPDTEHKPSIDELLEQEKAKELIDSAAKAEANKEAPPTMSAADTAPTPASPVIAPNSTKDAADPNNIAL